MSTCRTSRGGALAARSFAARPAPFMAALVLLLGCAHSNTRPSESPAATPAPVAEAPRSAPAPEPVPEAPEETITPEANARVRPPESPARLDPTEEITPQELATIPDPVPGAPTRDRPQDDAGSTSGAQGTHGGESGAVTAREGPWSVQIFASEDRGEAQRVARAAADRLQMPARVDHEAPLYKVRVGSFADEQEAQALRAQAVRAGYAGAFRVRARVP